MQKCVNIIALILAINNLNYIILHANRLDNKILVKTRKKQ